VGNREEKRNHLATEVTEKNGLKPAIGVHFGSLGAGACFEKEKEMNRQGIVKKVPAVMRRQTMKKSSAVLIALILVLVALSNAYADSYTYTTLNPPGGYNAGAEGICSYAINNAGTVVGWYKGGVGFSLSNGVLTNLYPPGLNPYSYITFPTGINDVGTIVGWYYNGNGVTSSFTLSNGGYTILNYPGTNYPGADGTATEATGINNTGMVVGWYTTGGNVYPFEATPPAQAGFTLSGTILSSGGTGIPGALVTLSGAATGTMTTDNNGNYSFTGLSDGSYTVTPSLSGATFTPLNVTINGANSTGDNISQATTSASVPALGPLGFVAAALGLGLTFKRRSK